MNLLDEVLFRAWVKGYLPPPWLEVSLFLFTAGLQNIFTRGY